MPTVTILFTDVPRSTERLVNLGDARGAEEIGLHLRHVSDIVESHGGHVVKTLGDGVMATFGSSTEAVLAAVALQQSASRDANTPDGLRIGINVGDVPEASGPGGVDVLGLPVVIARRLCDASADGEVLVSDLVRLLVGSRTDIDFEAIDDLSLKGIPEPARTWRVAWIPNENSPITVVVAEDSVLVRAGVVRLLTDENFQVLAEVGDYDALLEAVQIHRPMLVVTDVRMPPTQTDEGLRAAAMLRANDPNIAVLVLSQHVEPAAAALLLSNTATAVGYLLKERVSHIDDFIDACRVVAYGGVVIDPLVTEKLLRSADHVHAMSRLTEREREVLDLMAQGRSNTAIARQIHCATKTLESHVRSIFSKLDLAEDADDHRRVAAVVQWLHQEHRT